MVRHCNINKRRVEHLIVPIIRNLLKESEYMDIERMIFQINLRTQNISVRNKNHKKNMTYAINFYYQSFLNYIKQSDDFGIVKEMDSIYVYSKKKIESEWIIVDDID
jgi:hypothetical protein